MIAIDTSSLIAFLSGSKGPDVEWVDKVLTDKIGVLPPVVLTELLSDASLPKTTLELFTQLPLLNLSTHYWNNAGLLRAKIISGGFKARLADTLIAQACIENTVALITRDKDFRHFQKYGGLKLL
ncbi:MAG: PIN domain-containing protein [Deltaproteobacteria bacterium]|nr:PIN domain-containing protein [Deltaproteobacteria bacterium]